MNVPFRFGLVAPLASLFLILAAIYSGLSSTQSGIPVVLPKERLPWDECGEIRQVVVQVARGSLMMLNGKPVNQQEFRDTLTRVYRTKVVRVLFVEGRPDALYQDVVRVIDAADGTVDHLVVVLVRPGTDYMPCVPFEIPYSPLDPWLKGYYRARPPIATP